MMFAFPITEPSQVAHARRVTADFTRTLGLTETEVGKVSLVVTELANNLIKHAGHGELLAQSIMQEGHQGIELLALDNGPSMRNVTECLRDGYSTAGSPGTGLGAVVRASSQFEIYSAPGVGTVILARIIRRVQGTVEFPAAHSPVLGSSLTGLQTFASSSARSDPASPLPLSVGVVNVAKTGETVCGDGWAVNQHPGRALLMVADGLGHGEGAAEAAREAIRVFSARATATPVQIVERMHNALRATRGSAVAVAEIDQDARTVRYCGVGNIVSTLLHGERSESFVSDNGTVGYIAPKIREFTYAWMPNAVLIMHSDGLTQRWSVDKYPGLLARHPSIIAGVLYRDFRRGRDDATVLVAKAQQ